MNKAWICSFLVIVFFPVFATAGASCKGKGAKVFFINGLFNDRRTSEANLRALKEPLLRDVANSPLVGFENAYIVKHLDILQLAQAVLQRGVDDLSQFWVWLDGLEQAPSWFKVSVQRKMQRAKALDSRVALQKSSLETRAYIHQKGQRKASNRDPFRMD